VSTYSLSKIFCFLFPVFPTEEVDDSSGEASDNTNTPSQWIILALSLLVTTVVGYVNFMNPAQRWQQLRGNFDSNNDALLENYYYVVL